MPIENTDPGWQGTKHMYENVAPTPLEGTKRYLKGGKGHCYIFVPFLHKGVINITVVSLTSSSL